MVAKVVSAEEAVSLIKDGATITLSGIGGTMLPEQVRAALEARFLTEGHPKDLFWYDPNPTATLDFEKHWPEADLNALRQRGYTTRTGGSATLSAVALENGQLCSAMR
jgi:acyl CoA:acetate/3-ketoacid CoA transferase